MSKFKKNKKGLPAISTASLPDIVFMLLFFFMVTTTMRETTLLIEKPKLPNATEIKKLEHKSLVSTIYIGKSKDKRITGDIIQAKGYLGKYLPPLENFPSGDLYEDTKRLNKIIEDFIKEYPEQYLWTHKRYKHYVDENKDFYQNYINDKPNSNCHG